MDDIEEIENFRARKGLTIAALAAELGVTPYYLGQVLKRKNKLTEGLKARFVALQAKQSPSFRDVVPLVVRFTTEEYSQLCRAAGVDQLSPAQAEEFWRERIMNELVPQARATVAAALAAEDAAPAPGYGEAREPFA